MRYVWIYLLCGYILYSRSQFYGIFLTIHLDFLSIQDFVCTCTSNSIICLTKIPADGNPGWQLKLVPIFCQIRLLTAPANLQEYFMLCTYVWFHSRQMFVSDKCHTTCWWFVPKVVRWPICCHFWGMLKEIKLLCNT